MTMFMGKLQLVWSSHVYRLKSDQICRKNLDEKTEIGDIDLYSSIAINFL